MPAASDACPEHSACAGFLFGTIYMERTATSSPQAREPTSALQDADPPINDSIMLREEERLL
jgi:hypothetical protein